ncbi:Methionine synthase, partial [Symbiodinium microadriaticum]
MGESTYWCQGDFIAPKGYSDYISAFACTGGIGCHEQRQKFEEKGEIDQAVADRLAEAFAELIHLKIRSSEKAGFRMLTRPDEKLSLEDMLKVKYQGIRPAPGYPSQPDHREKKTLWDLLEVDRLTDEKLSLTESYMMMPSASVSALVFAHPEAKYFSVGQVNVDQVQSYSERRGEAGVEGTERWLGSTVLGYEKQCLHSVPSFNYSRERRPVPRKRFSTMKLFKPSTPEQQIESLRSQKCEVECTAEHVQPKSGCKLVDPCRVE